VDLETDAVAGAVAEAFAVAGRRDHGARGRVDVVTAVRAGTYGGHAGELRLEDDVVDPPVRPRDATGGERARDVGAVAVDAGPGVDHDQIAGLDAAPPGDGVGLGAVLAGGDDGRERLALGAAVVVLLEEAPGDLGLRTPDEAFADDHGEGEVDDRRGVTDGLDLGRLLDDAQPRHAAADVTQAAVVGAAQGAVTGVADGGGLVAERAAAAHALAHGGGRVGEQVDAVAAHELEPADLLVHLLDEA